MIEARFWVMPRSVSVAKKLAASVSLPRSSLTPTARPACAAPATTRAAQAEASKVEILMMVLLQFRTTPRLARLTADVWRHSSSMIGGLHRDLRVDCAEHGLAQR